MKKSVDYALVALILLENMLLCVFNHGLLGQAANSIGYFLVGITIGTLALYKFYGQTWARMPVVKTARTLPYVLYGVGVSLLCVGYFFVLRKHAVSVGDSDVIPLIQIFCKRFVSGTFPYTPITDFGYVLQPTYLPMHWLPFVPAMLLHFDLRWIPLIVWSLAALMLVVSAKRINNWKTAVVAILLLFLAHGLLVLHQNNSIITTTVEVMIGGYYMLASAALAGDNGWVQGAFFSLCLLSRYSIVLWMPLYIATLLLSGRKKQLLQSLSVISIAVLIVYVAPFLSRDWGMFLRGYRYYDLAALFEWSPKTQGTALPYQLNRGTGLAWWFYSLHTKLPVYERLQLLQRTHLLCCMLLVAGITVWYAKHKNKINTNIFLICSLKLYLAVFLFLIQVPYPYLMITGNFVSIVLFIEQAGYLALPATNNEQRIRT